LGPLAKSLGVEISYLGVPMVDHKIFLVAKAPTFEAVRSFIVKSALVQTNTTHIYPTLPIEEARKPVDDLPPVF
jgi:hypothetical protein